MLSGCVAPLLSPQINDAAERVLTRHGIEVVYAAGEGCCGSLAHHMGREHDALAQVRANVDAWTAEIERGGLDAILDHRVRLRHHHQGLRLHAARRCRPMPKKPRAFPRWRATFPNISRR